MATSSVPSYGPMLQNCGNPVRFRHHPEVMTSFFASATFLIFAAFCPSLPQNPPPPPASPPPPTIARRCWTSWPAGVSSQIGVTVTTTTPCRGLAAAITTTRVSGTSAHREGARDSGDLRHLAREVNVRLARLDLVISSSGRRRKGDLGLELLILLQTLIAFLRSDPGV